MREALRCAVDIRDVAASRDALSSRSVMLVDVLNALKDCIGFDAETSGFALV